MNRVAEVCPFLGLYDDRDTRYDYASPANCCHTRRPALPVEPSYQRRYCLPGAWSTCGLYIAAQHNGVVDRAKGARSRRVLVISVTAVAAMIVVGVLLLRTGVLRPERVSALFAMGGTHTGQDMADTPSTPNSPTPTAPSGPVSERMGDQAAWPQPNLSPTRVSLDVPVSATPSPTATPPPSLTPTPTLTSSATPSPTLTPFPTEPPTPTATATPLPTATATASPVPIYRPLPTRVQYQPPQIVAPTSGQSFGPGATIVLQWESVGTLTSDEFYVISLWYSHGSETWYDETPWTRATTWTVSEHDYLPALSNDGLFFWSVRVMRQTGTDASGRAVGEPASPPSATSTFNWARPPEKTAVPPPP